MLGDFFKIVYMFKFSVANVVKHVKKAELFGLQSHLRHVYHWVTPWFQQRLLLTQYAIRPQRTFGTASKERTQRLRYTFEDKF